MTEFIILPFVFVSALILRSLKKQGIQFFPRSRNLLLDLGVFPVHDHYHEPTFDHRNPKSDFSADRHLPGIDLNIDSQLTFLQNLTFEQELEGIPFQKSGDGEFYFKNNGYEPGDAEYWYQIIRFLKPKNIIEIGSGFSTLIAVKALKQNRAENPDYVCNHICIESFEAPWLEQQGIAVERKMVEDLDLSFFQQLGENDILFIDSTHIIKPEGDVLYEYLQILPTLQKGVFVHIHDIFTPKNYLEGWLKENVFFWNEQYLLEAFLTENMHWEVIGGLNYLQHNHHEDLKRVAPYLNKHHQPGSFYIRKRT